MKDENHNETPGQGRNHEPGPHPDGPEFFVDNDPYDWGEKTITGEQLRVRASLPDDVEIFRKVPGQPDQEIKDDTVVDLTEQKGPDHFSTQAVGSGAG